MLNVHSQYARVFDGDCVNWTEDRNFNIMFLKRQQTYCNDLLKRRGYLFLRDVYEMIGIPITKKVVLLVGYLKNLMK